MQDVTDRRPRLAAPRELEQHAGVEIAGPRRHNQTFERREAHARIDRLTVEQSRRGATVSELQRNEASPATGELKRRSRQSFVRQAVKPEAAQSAAEPPLGRQR